MTNKITYKDIVKIDNLHFNDYLKIDAHSFSSLKMMKNGVKMDFKVTEKVTIGKLVDDILTNGSSETSVLHPNYAIAKDIAEKVKSELGNQILSLLKFQTSYTSNICFESFSLKTKGRLDCKLGNLAVIDFKVTEKAKSNSEVDSLIKFMQYDNQILHYSRFENFREKYFFVFSKKANKTFFRKRLQTQQEVDFAENWWIEKILEHGEVI